MLTNEQESNIVQFAVERCRAYAVVLFGSAAKGRLRADSDVDIAYLSHDRMSAYDRFIAAQRLSDILKREVDLVDFFETNTVMQAQIVATGKLLYDAEPLYRQEAFRVALKSYALLNEERAEIIHAYENGSGG